MPSHDEAMPCWDGWAWLGGVRRGYKSDPNTEGAPTLRDRPATRAPLSATHPPKQARRQRRSHRSAETTKENAAAMEW
jgi:hypothetical protein